MSRKRAALSAMTEGEIEDLEEIMDSIELPIIGTNVKVDEGSTNNDNPDITMNTSNTGELSPTPVTPINETAVGLSHQELVSATDEAVEYPVTPNNEHTIGVTPTVSANDTVMNVSKVVSDITNTSVTMELNESLVTPTNEAEEEVTPCQSVTSSDLSVSFLNQGLVTPENNSILSTLTRLSHRQTDDNQQ